VALDPLLLEILVCPEDKQPLWYLEDEDALVNLRLRRRYPIRDGIPVMLVDEAEPLDDDELARLEEKAPRSGVLTGAPRAPGAAGDTTA
jgi:hypothetical protein